MHDPFPIPPPEALQNLIRPIAEYLSLHTLPLHFHEVAIAALLYHVTNVYLAPTFSRFFFPRIYNKFNARTKLNWDAHIVSFVQSSLINVLALWVIFADEERAEMNWQGKIWGYTGASGLIQAFAGGYFVWDLFITLQNINIFGLGMLAHAVSALFVFSLGFRPFLNFYGPTFILYELSSPFLNIHWFCDKLNLTGSKLQLYNGILLLFTFFSARLVWGSYQSYCVYIDVYKALNHGHIAQRDHELGNTNSTINGVQGSEIMKFAGDRVVPMWLAGCYLLSNITLNGLNWYWFGKMIETIRKRFDPPFGTRMPEKATPEIVKEEEKTLVEGIDVATPPATPGNVTPAIVEATDYVSAVHIEKDGGNLKVEAAEIRNRTTRRAG
ncbi:DUF887-domain-containing protein [Lojkania enalia]|uniref:DUF887-domain-containing protein n=1 Tax=Lojkania enalia TaxID=147567 RepID=A0A9P4N4W9_9PLEO|nr:DUF887-domain-containing protein [Didymosphaeria enalia]